MRWVLRLTSDCSSSSGEPSSSVCFDRPTMKFSVVSPCLFTRTRRAPLTLPHVQNLFLFHQYLLHLQWAFRLARAAPPSLSIVVVEEHHPD